MSQVTVIGPTVVDLIFELPAAITRQASEQHYWRLRLGEKIRGQSHLGVGGTGANVAVGLSRLGLKVTLYTRLTADALGRLLADRLMEEGVRLVSQRTAGSPPLSVILPTVGDQTIITDHQTDEDYQINRWPETGWLHLGALSLESVDFYQEAVKHLSDSHQPLSLNPREEVLRAKPRPFRLALAKTTVLFLNRQEGLDLTGSGRTVSTRDLARAILRFGPKIVCLTDGERPVQVATREGVICGIPLTPAERCLDATGAGDAFTSGFLYGLVGTDRLIYKREHLSQALQLGLANAGAVVLAIGAQNGLLNRRGAADQRELVTVEDND